MVKHNSTPMTQKEIIARLDKPKSMRYIRNLMKPLFETARAKFGDAIVEIVEREHWGPNFDAYYDVWVNRGFAEIDDFFNKSLLDLQLEKFVAVLAQIKTTDDYRDTPRKLVRTSTKHRQNNRSHYVAIGH